MVIIILLLHPLPFLLFILPYQIISFLLNIYIIYIYNIYFATLVNTDIALLPESLTLKNTVALFVLSKISAYSSLEFSV